MLRRTIGQDELRFGPQAASRRSSLDALTCLINWAPLAVAVDGIHSARKGEPAWPPLSLFKALLIAVWYDLSDVKLAEAPDDRASFRRFCGLSSRDATPERTAFVQFRKELLARDLDKALFEAITRQLKAKAITVKTGALVDATVIASASRGDSEADWAAHRKHKAVHGFKAHVGANADTAIVEELSVTPGNVHHGRAGHGALPDDPGAVYADSGYRGQAFATAVQAKGGFPHVVQTSVWGRDGMAPCKN